MGHPISTKTSLPMNSFTRADRNRTATTVYLGPKHQSSFWGRNSPGPAVYSPTAAVGAQVSSEKPNVPKFGFGTELRRAASAPSLESLAPPKRFLTRDLSRKAMFGVHSPGPAMYARQDDGLGSVLVGKSTPNEPRYTMRPKLEYMVVREYAEQAAVPGPGAYPRKETIGPEGESVYPNSAARVAFGKEARLGKKPLKLYMGKAHEKSMKGLFTPGPGTYAEGTNAPLNGKLMPQYKAAPAFSFGSDDRF